MRIFLLVLLAPLRCSAFVSRSTRDFRRLAYVLYADADSNDDQPQPQDLLDRASRLRQEASDLESRIREEGKSVSGRQEVTTMAEAPTYQTIDNSIWTFSYRFASQPEPDDDAGDAAAIRKFYSGKTTLRFRDDGFTDLIEDSSSNPEASRLSVTKAWGWDVETSNKDDKDYLMFSIDADLPASDGDGAKRFYFQSGLERDGNCIELKEGTVTIKSEVFDKSTPAGFFGFLSPKGILAQFRYVGDFVAKPST